MQLWECFFFGRLGRNLILTDLERFSISLEDYCPTFSLTIGQARRKPTSWPWWQVDLAKQSSVGADNESDDEGNGWCSKIFRFSWLIFWLVHSTGRRCLLFTVLSDNRWGQGVFWEDVCMNESIWPSNYQHWRGSRVEKSRMSMWRVVLKKIIEHQWRNLDTVWTVWVHGSPQKNLRLVH